MCVCLCVRVYVRPFDRVPAHVQENVETKDINIVLELNQIFGVFATCCHIKRNIPYTRNEVKQLKLKNTTPETTWTLK